MREGTGWRYHRVSTLRTICPCFTTKRDVEACRTSVLGHKTDLALEIALVVRLPEPLAPQRERERELPSLLASKRLPPILSALCWVDLRARKLQGRLLAVL